MLTRRQTEIAGEVSPGREAADITDKREDAVATKRPIARNRP